MAKKQVLKKRKPAAQEGDEAGGEQKKKRMWWEDELDGQRRSARDGPEENAAYFREEVRRHLRGGLPLLLSALPSGQTPLAWASEELWRRDSAMSHVRSRQSSGLPATGCCSAFEVLARHHDLCL